jgi:hypothetical protein
MLVTTEDIVSHIREWSIERSENPELSEADSEAILSEFLEWIDPEEDELEIVSIEF